jgi:cytochrome c-type biogenesis protein CcmH/NrfG
MTVEEYIAKLKARPKDRETTAESFALVEEALKAHPDSARLWCFRGALIQLGPVPEESGYKLEDALASYRKAVELEPDCPKGWEELGHYHDVHLDDERSAREFWAKAEKLRKANAKGA